MHVERPQKVKSHKKKSKDQKKSDNDKKKKRGDDGTSSDNYTSNTESLSGYLDSSSEEEVGHVTNFPQRGPKPWLVEKKCNYHAVNFQNDIS